MKKIFIIEIILLIVCTICLPVFATNEPTATATETAVTEDGKPFIGGGAFISEDNPVNIDYQQLETAYTEILDFAKNDSNIIAVKMLPESNIILVAITEESPELMKEYAKMFIQQYGSFVVVTNDIDASISGTEAGGGNYKGNNSSDNVWLWSICGLVILGLIIQLRRVPALQTTNGNIITQNTTISRKETISAIRKNEIAPTDKVYNSILQKIYKDSK